MKQTSARGPTHPSEHPSAAMAGFVHVGARLAALRKHLPLRLAQSQLMDRAPFCSFIIAQLARRA